MEHLCSYLLLFIGHTPFSLYNLPTPFPLSLSSSAGTRLVNFGFDLFVLSQKTQKFSR